MYEDQPLNNICNLPFLHTPNIGKIRVKVGTKTNYLSYFMSSCTNRIAVFSNFFLLIYSQPRGKENRACDFFPFEYFLNNQFLIVFMETTLSNLVELIISNSLLEKTRVRFSAAFCYKCVCKV